VVGTIIERHQDHDYGGSTPSSNDFAFTDVECFTTVEDYSDNGVMVGIAKREALDAGKLGMATALDEGADSSPAIDPLFEGATASGPDVMPLFIIRGRLG
jgi:hypothetical protein